ncbi:hypothetical protein [Flagellimonas sp.]|uniref:hypothetical protein n=1 Tax=Flagellimonas sp. TaxID=2058762 RepID=UPI003BB1FBB8
MRSLYLILFLVATILSCNTKTNKKGTIIYGKINSAESGTVYLNEIDHFDNLNENFTIDSTAISKNGAFKFKRHNLNSKLVSISTEKFKPFTYQIYSTAPQTYFFGNCEKFFTSIPTFYISNEETININWTETKSIDSISSPDNSGALQVKLRDFYLNSNRIGKGKLDYDVKSDYKTYWEQMLIERDLDLKAVDRNNIKTENSFDNYVYSEIYLGHLNKYLNWFEQNFPDQVESLIKNPESDKFYSNIFQEYNMHQWNSKSLEYYKFTERYLNYHMNIRGKSFENYYKSTQDKRRVAETILSGKNKQRYLKLIDLRMNNDL